MFVTFASEFNGSSIPAPKVVPRQILPPHVDGFLQQHLPHCHCVPPVIHTLSRCRRPLYGFLDFLRRGRCLLLSLLESVPEVAAKLKEPSTKDCKSRMW